jgi:hypothetical protein
MTKEQRKPWFEIITSKMNQLAEEFGLDPISSERLRETVMEIARTQYKSGNNSGISWAYRQIEKRAAS